MSENRKCKVEGCDRRREFDWFPHCPAHAMRVRRTGSPGSATIRKYTKKEATNGRPVQVEG